MSKLYNYIKNQYLMGALSEDDLVKMVEMKRITNEERLQIIAEVGER